MLLTFFVLGKDLVVTDPRGYNYPITREIEPFREKFILNTEVKTVRKTIDDKYIVNTSKGSYTAKHVVVSFSSGVLLAKKVQFQPDLPTWKTEALKYVPMGHYCKYFFKFPYQFWEKNVTLHHFSNYTPGTLCPLAEYEPASFVSW